MLTRLYVDNVNCLVNFDLRLDRVQLLAGRNGSGKTSVFDVLGSVQRLVARAGRLGLTFPSSSRTRWQTSTVQTVECEVSGNGGQYVYRLQVEHPGGKSKSRIKNEELLFNGGRLFQFASGTVQLFRDDLSEGPAFQFDQEQSGLGAVGTLQDSQKLTWFRDWLDSLRLVSPNPFGMRGLSEAEEAFPRVDMTDFASWYQYLSLEHPQVTRKLADSLAELWDGCQGLKFEKVGPAARVLQMSFRHGEGGPVQSYDFQELSDGQRVLTVLYTLLHFASATPDSLVVLDEPANFVALAEIQPWLSQMVDAAEDEGFQLLIASHHPEVVDFLGTEQTVWLERVASGPTRIATFATEGGSVLKPSELVVRGWQDG